MTRRARPTAEPRASARESCPGIVENRRGRQAHRQPGRTSDQATENRGDSRSTRFSVAIAIVVAGSSTLARANDAELDRATVVFARGAAIYKTDGNGRAEVELARLPEGSHALALRTDAGGRVVIAEVSGGGWWISLDGTAAKWNAVAQCTAGPAQLDPDGECVLCRDRTAAGVVVNLGSGRSTAIDVPPTARIVGSGPQRRLVWPDATGIWSAPLRDAKRKTRVAPEPPLRAFLPSPDGTRAVGVYASFVYDGKRQRPAEILMGFALDGEAARRKMIRTGAPLQWSHDNQWVLVQDGAAACVMRANGGQYKCWKGFTAVSIAPDGAYALVLGSRNGAKLPAAPAATKSAIAEPVATPTGPLALYRAKLDGPFDAPPQLVVKVIDGGAVWIPGRP